MILEITTEDFSRLSKKEKEKVFEKFLGVEVNEIVKGSMTNMKYGEYKVRFDDCGYCRIKIEPTEQGKADIKIYNYTLEKWEDEVQK